VLRAAFNALSPGDRTGTAAGRNLNTRIDHLNRSTTLPPGWDGFEDYQGLVNAGIAVQPTQSSVLDYLKGFATLKFDAKRSTFTTEEWRGKVRGSLAATTAGQPAPHATRAADAPPPDRQTHPRLVRHGKSR